MTTRRLSIPLVVTAAAAAVGSLPSVIGGVSLDTGSNGASTLIDKARPYHHRRRRTKSSQHHNHNDEHRQLDQNNNNFQIDSTYSLKFSQCIDLKLYDEDLFDDNVIEYTKAGQILSTKSYALFHVCQDSDCYYESNDDLYVVDLSVYIQNVASYYANVQSNYCEACDLYYYNFCVTQQGDDDDDDGGNNYNNYNDNNGDDAAAAANGDDDAYVANDDDANNGDDAARRQRHRKTTSYITCNQCQSYGCNNNYGGDDDDGQYQNNNNNNNDDDNNAVVELIEDISQCLNTGMKFNDNELYVGFICSPYDGDGIELAVFLDNECTVYTTMTSFSDIPNYYIYNDADTFSAAETFIKSVFENTMSCAVEEFGNPAYQQQQNYGDDDAANNNSNNYNGNDEVSDYCKGIFEEEEAVAFSSCSADYGNDDQNQNNNNNNNNNQMDDDTVSFYEFDLNYDEADDLDQVCTVLQTMDGEYYYNYDEDYSGTWNEHSWSAKRKKNKKDGKSGSWGFLTDTNGGYAGSGLAILVYVMAAVAVIIGVLFVVGLNERRKRDRRTMNMYYSGGRLV